jgi:ABC-2 type transport system ATP-binding protein
MDHSLAVQTENLSKQFGHFTAVDQVSISVKKGEVFGFLGANGAGKTTTIRMLCGLLQPSGGKAWVNGYDIYAAANQIKNSIGYMSQKFSLYNDLTVAENITFYGGIYGLKQDALKRKSRRLLELLTLNAIKDKLTGEIPPGWKQRLALGCAILHEPEILFLDEPTGGVDPVSRRAFWNLIYQYADQGKTVFVTTHYMDESEYCSRLSVMYAGKVIAIGTPTELKEQYELATMQDVFIRIVQEQIENGSD